MGNNVPQLSLASNYINGSSAVGGFGHFQIVFVDDDGNETEIEVQAPALWTIPLNGEWQFQNRDHTTSSNYGDTERYAITTILTGVEARDAWNILLSVHSQFVLAQQGGNAFLYDPTYNSNTYANTLLSIIGVDLDDHRNSATPNDVNSGFPGENRNALNDANYPNDAINLTINGSDNSNSIFTGNGADTLIGLEGNDFLSGGGNDDIIYGGADRDTAIFIGEFSDFSFQSSVYLGSAAILVSDLNVSDGDQGTDTLIGVEYARFDGANSSTLYNFTLNMVVSGYSDGSGANTGGNDGQGGIDAGNSIGEALSITIPWSTSSGTVGGSDSNDYLQFVTTGSGTFEVTLSGLSDDINLRLLDYQGNQLTASTNSGSSDETITHNFGDNQLYYIRVDPNGSATSNYELNISTNASTSGSNEPDLIIQNATIDSGTYQPGDTVTLNWEVLNQGTGEAGSSRVGIYLSTNDIISQVDTLVDFNSTTSLVAGAIDSNESDSFTLDPNLAPGTYYIGLIADDQFNVEESDDANNYDTFFQITVGAPTAAYDFSILAVSLDDYIIEEGTDTTLRYTVTNTGSQNTTEAVRQGFWISTDTTFGNADDDYLEFDGAGFLSSGEINEQSDTLGDLADYPAGTYYIFTMADYDNRFVEGDENNNVSNYVVLTIVEEAYDFSILSVSLDDTVIEQGTTTTLRYTVTNTGSLDTTEAVRQGFWISTDTTFGDADDVYLESDGAGFLSSGEINEQSDTLQDLADFSPGTYYIFAMADYQNEFAEGDETNNVSNYVTLTITDPAYDFSILTASLDDSVITQGASTTLRYTVTNTGSQDTAESVYQGFWISTDTTFGNVDDIYLESDGAGYLSSGEVNQQSDNLGGLSNFTAGTYYIYTVADYQNQLVEGDETNNVSTPIQLEILAPPDLTASHLTVDSEVWAEGDTVIANWNINNVGLGEGNASGSGLYLSTDNNITTEDILLSFDASTGNMSVGEINAEGVTPVIDSSIAPGIYWIGVIADFENVVFESDETNNISNLIEVTVLAPAPIFTESRDVYFGYDYDETIYALGGNDAIRGAGGDDTIFGGAGRDNLFGDAGADELRGGDNNDKLNGGDDNDSIYGDAGIDLLFGALGDDRLYGGDGVDKIFGNEGIDVAFGGNGNDVIYGDDGDDKLHGDAGDDRVIGRNDNDQLWGDDGNDTLKGGFGNDILNGGADNDILFGNADSDFLYGGAGNDQLFGGLGADTFEFRFSDGAASDRVNDFEIGDIVKLKGFGFANAGAAAGSFFQFGSNVKFQMGGVEIVFVDALLADVIAAVSVDGNSELPTIPDSKAVISEVAAPTNDELSDTPSLAQDAIAGFIAEYSVHSPLIVTNPQGIAEIFTHDDLVFDADLIGAY